VSIHFSPVIGAQESGSSSTFSVRSIDLHQLGERASPVVVLDHFHVRGRPFPPHPHAGFSAVTYVFEDWQAFEAAPRWATTL
jgi:redox-sensitive bicupin YhaK (pirin superfamily)